MTLYWLEPGWKDACCARCGRNIAQDGGDPDWGFCFACMQERKQEKIMEQEAERDRAKYYAKLEREYYEELEKESDKELLK